MGRLSASIPMKCMDQMPVPMETAPPASHARAAAPLEAVILEARSSAVYDANDATQTETRTSHGLYCAGTSRSSTLNGSLHRRASGSEELVAGRNVHCSTLA